ncbi:MAG: hypothetical protein IIY21_10890 [Clostridiales bacterium]|nr:hypothetical protein [Clostridiales bacterium]MBQ1571186.1 hypothetical protein [Clostridiales bacterium]
MIRTDFAFPVVPIGEQDQNDFFRKKQDRLNDHIANNLNRTLTMFKYGGLPEELHERDIEFTYQTQGHGSLTYKDGRTRFFYGTFAPPINYLYENTGYRIVNPWAEGVDGLYRIVNLAPVDMGADQYDEGKECVIIRNDPLCVGLLPIFTKYGMFEVENNLTMFLSDVNLRQIIQMIATDDSAYESALQVLRDIEAGKQGIIMDDAFGDNGFRGNPLTVPANFMIQLIEFSQYIKATECNEIGIDANYNMKRERINDEEVSQNADILRPLVDVMLEERKEGYNAFRDYTGGEVDIQVEFDSVWSKYNRDYQMAVPNEDGEETTSEEVLEETETETTAPEENVSRETSEEETVEEETTEEGSDELEKETSTEETETTIEEVVGDIQEIVEDITEAVTNTEEEKGEEDNEES